MRAECFRGRGRSVHWLALLLPCLLLPNESTAQYFGRNKVKYRDFDFKVLETRHFDVYFYEREREAARLAARMAERWYDRFTTLLDHELTGRQPLILYASHPEFAQTTAIPGEIGEATGGVTEAFKRRIVLPMEGTLSATDHVIGHELVHAFQYDLSGVSPSQPLFGAPALNVLPLWATEGLAEYLSLGPRSTMTAMWMRDGLLHDRLPSLNDLADPYEYFPYRWGHALWAYIGGRFGDEAVWEVFRTGVSRRSIGVAIDSVLRIPADTLVADWHRALRQQYGPLRQITTVPDSAGTRLSSDGDNVTDLAPAVSPDGRWLLYLSSRDPYSIDLYLADAKTGEVIERLTESALDPHYESLQFISSAGSWAADNERIAFTVNAGGKPGLVLMLASSGERIRTYELPQFGAIYNPTWSPDGTRIAFAANDGGFLDLWVITLESGSLRRLTRGSQAELHPAWSPDGRWIAITTDRFGEGFSLALVNPDGGAIQQVRTFDGATTINPSWGPDGDLYFVSNPDGIPDLYRTDLTGAPPERLTHLYTGVSGITDLSPAIGVASATGEVIFTAYKKGGHRLYRLRREPQPTLAGPAATGLDAAELPPVRRRAQGISAFVDNDEDGLPSPANFQVRDYSSQISLDYISPPTLGLSIGGYWSYVGGGIALGFSDMLGLHELGTQLQAQIVNGEVLNGLGAQVTYLNRANRFNWGAVVGQTPLVSQAFGQALVDPDNDGQVELLQQTLTFWNVSRHAFLVSQYPFSTSTRLELSAGYERQSFNAEMRTILIDPFTGQELQESTTEAPACGDSLSVRRQLCQPGTLSQFRGGAALVHDRSLMGPTGPIDGTRYRLEASPSFGTLTYMGVLGDWRRYFRVASPLTLGVRLMHYGRYLSGAEDERLSQLFLGYPSLVRGYDNGSFSLTRCPENAPAEACSEIQVYDELFGSRLAAGNAELRLSLFGPVGILGRSFLPADLVGFYDAGLAWSTNQAETPGIDERAWFEGGDRDPLTSAGVGIRFNLFGFALADVYWVEPFDRPLRGGYLSFSFNTGF